VHHPHRLYPYDSFGERRYFLTINTFRRQKGFRQSWVVRITLKQILRAATQRSFVISAYCFMPDHFHALVHGQSADSDLHGFVRVAKQMSSHQFVRFTGRPLWKKSYWDHTLRGGPATVDVVRYIVFNPVKAGIVSDPMDYPHWGSEIYTREELLDLIATGGSPDL
jgi:putative transposase